MTTTQAITSPQVLTLANISIRQDSEGRFCLNDLHKAASGTNWAKDDKNAPKFWLNNQSTSGLILELTGVESGGILPLYVRTGRNGGTFVMKELVYAYAMWISPKFHLEVIRAYDQLTTQTCRSHVGYRVVFLFLNDVIPSIKLFSLT